MEPECSLPQSQVPATNEAYSLTASQHDTFLRVGVFSTSLNPQVGGPPLVGCQRLLIQYIRSCPPYWRPFLHPQHEDAPCRGDRDPLNTESVRTYRCKMYVNWHSSSLEETKYQYKLCLISSFRCGVDMYCALLGYYAASSGNFIPTFRDNISVPSFRRSRFLDPLKMRKRGCPETSVRNLPLLAA